MRPFTALCLTPRPWLLLPLLALLACSTSAPRSGQSRRAYASYGVTRVDVVVVGLNTPGPASDEDLRLQLAVPPVLGPAEAIPGAASESQKYSRLLGRALLRRLRERGFDARLAGAEPTLRAQRQRALDAQRHAVLLVQHLVVTEAWAGLRTRVRARTIDRGRIEDPLSVDVSAYIPMRYAGLLLPASVQLVDAETGVLLYRGPQLDVAAGDRLHSGASFMRWGQMRPVADKGTIDDDVAIARAADMAVQELAPSRLRRQVQLDSARRLAASEPVELRQEWRLALGLEAAQASFPVALDLGPMTVDLPEGSARNVRVDMGRLPRGLGPAASLQLSFRHRRWLFALGLREHYLPAVERRTYLRSDPDAARAFVLTLGPSHLLGLDLQVGYQRFFGGGLGMRVLLGPRLSWHLLSSELPRGTRERSVPIALGLGASVEPFVRLDPVELSLALQSSLGYDLAGGLSSQATLLLRLGWIF